MICHFESLSAYEDSESIVVVVPFHTQILFHPRETSVANISAIEEGEQIQQA
jgi:hypothetical protein